MEPQLIDYYNEIPHGINVIDKMNEELDELQKKYDELQKKVNKFIPPIIIVDTVDEYKKKCKLFEEDLVTKIEEFLKDEETGLHAIIEEGEKKGPPLHWQHLYSLFSYAYDFVSFAQLTFAQHTHGTCEEKIINELDNITNNKNKEWCETRVKTAFEVCLKGQKTAFEAYLEGHGHADFEVCLKEHGNADYSESWFDNIIGDLTNHIINGDDVGGKLRTGEYLPSIYLDNCSDFSNVYEGDGIFRSLICYKCKKCGKIDNYLDSDELICWDCNDCD